MKRTQKISFLLSRFRRLSDKTLSAMLTVKSKRPLLGHMIMLTEIVVGSVNRNWVKLLVLLLNKIRRIYDRQGLPGTVKYLKACAIVVQQIAAGHYVNDLTPLGPRISRSKGGLPRFLPVEIRKQMRDPKIQKWVLTILSVFRVMVYDTNPKLSTITAPSTACFDKFPLLYRNIPNALDSLGFTNAILREPSMSPIFSASPTSRSTLGEYSTHPRSIIYSLITLPKFGEVWNSLLWFINQYPSLLNKIIHYGHLLNDPRYSYWRKPNIGKIGLKQEAAGKVRVFSFADPLSQWVLRPLHRYIFSKLKLLPMDGTFDQLKPLSRVPWVKSQIFSLDLTAATDRLPIEFQFSILKTLFGEAYAQNWKTLLVGRQYAYKYTDIHTKKIEAGLLNYSVGQPMGLLSSWAMLALTHHVIVQIAAKFSGCPLPFTGYGLLGDDIVIWNRRVAHWYLKIMVWLGVDINLTKSIISKTGLGLEFAKKTIVKGEDISPIPLKEYFASHDSSASLVSFTTKYRLPLNQIKKLIGLGYKSSTKSRRYQMLMIALRSPVSVELFLQVLIKSVESCSPSDTTPLSKVFSAWYSLCTSVLDSLEKDMLKIDKYLESYETLGVIPSSLSGFALPSEGKTYPRNDRDPRVFLEFLMKEVDETRIESIILARAELDSLHDDFKYFQSSLHTLKRYLMSNILVQRFGILNSWTTGVWFEIDRSLQIYFALENRYSTLQIKQLLNPTPLDSVTSRKNFDKRLDQLWTRWSSILLKRSTVKFSSK